MKPLILQDTDGNLLKVFADGRVVCDCLMNLYNKQRDYASNCKHAKKLIKDFPDLDEYEEI